MSYDHQPPKPHPNFLASEFALNRLKPMAELEAISTYWNNQWRVLRRLASSAEGTDRDLYAVAADNAANRAYRLEDLIYRRQQMTQNSLLFVFQEARRLRQQQSRFEPIPEKAA